MEEPYVEVAGVRAFIGDRRRYGSREGGTTYTWVRFVAPDGFEHWTDPWPCLMPRKSEVEAVCRQIAEGAYDEQRARGTP